MEHNKKISSREQALLASLSLALVVGCIWILVLHSQIASSRMRVGQLEHTIRKLQNTPSNLYAEAAQARVSREYEVSASACKKLIMEYPTSDEASKARALLSVLQVATAREKAARDADLAREKAVRKAEMRRQKAAELAKHRAYEESIRPPLKLTKAMVTFNSIDNPEARVVVRNISNKVVDAYTIGFYCYDRYGQPVNHYVDDTNRYGALSQHTIRPGQSFGSDWYWTLFGHENTSRVRAVLEKVHMKDGSVWTPRSGQEVAIEGRSSK